MRKVIFLKATYIESTPSKFQVIKKYLQISDSEMHESDTMNNTNKPINASLMFITMDLYYFLFLDVAVREIYSHA